MQEADLALYSYSLTFNSAFITNRLILPIFISVTTRDEEKHSRLLIPLSRMGRKRGVLVPLSLYLTGIRGTKQKMESLSHNHLCEGVLIKGSPSPYRLLSGEGQEVYFG